MAYTTFTAGQVLTAAAANGIQFRIATGSGYGGAASTVVTFLAGSFTAVPVLLLTNYEQTLRNVTAVTSTSFTYQNVGGANASYSYIAVQL